MARHCRPPTVSRCVWSHRGWFGVANVKWLRRIEVRDTRFLGRFMGRDYVTIREERHGDATIMAETTVGRMLLKSAPARVTLRDGRYRIDGMHGAPRRSPLSR